MIPDFAHSLGGGTLDAIRRRIFEGPAGGSGRRRGGPTAPVQSRQSPEFVLARSAVVIDVAKGVPFEHTLFGYQSP